jgi:hypothetical protein
VPIIHLQLSWKYAPPLARTVYPNTLLLRRGLINRTVHDAYPAARELAESCNHYLGVDGSTMRHQRRGVSMENRIWDQDEEKALPW